MRSESRTALLFDTCTLHVAKSLLTVAGVGERPPSFHCRRAAIYVRSTSLFPVFYWWRRRVNLQFCT